jgi:hypothetical protein
MEASGALRVTRAGSLPKDQLIQYENLREREK